MNVRAVIIQTVAALALVAAVEAARGAPPENADSALAPWFQSLETPQGSSCCSIADCRNYPYRTAGDHYVIEYQGRELDVPSDAVLERYDNPTGRAVACVYNGTVLCFVRAAES